MLVVSWTETNLEIDTFNNCHRVPLRWWDYNLDDTIWSVVSPSARSCPEMLMCERRQSTKTSVCAIHDLEKRLVTVQTNSGKAVRNYVILCGVDDEIQFEIGGVAEHSVAFYETSHGYEMNRSADERSSLITWQQDVFETLRARNRAKISEARSIETW
ncbi:hypothetical protein BDZ89DRAFT_1033880 [Hymenopellis radicata]|nr:hypothetical protein BDZ89DRAFT_1033880 [Hymenopellis radicata]